MINVRKYTSDDFQIIRDWYARHDQLGFKEEFIPSFSTYIVECQEEPVASLSLITTPISGYAYLENFIANPDFTPEARKLAIDILVNYVEEDALELGYKRLICMAPNAKLVERYKELGYQVSLTGVTTLVKTLGVE